MRRFPLFLMHPNRLAMICWAVALLGLATACPPAIPPDDPHLVKGSELPGDVAGLLTYARAKRAKAEAAEPFDRRAAANALAALRKARGIAPGNHEVLQAGAEVARALGERAQSPGAQLKYAQLGLAFTEAGRTRFTGEVTFHYFHAALLGLKVDAYRATAMSVVPELRKAAERAITLDRTFDRAGPLRILGSLLVKVPSSAPFHGDVEKGIALLKEAAKIAPGHPLNHFFLAEALAADDEHDAAARHFTRVICAPTGNGWDASMAKRYRERSRSALQQLKRSTTPTCS